LGHEGALRSIRQGVEVTGLILLGIATALWLCIGGVALANNHPGWTCAILFVGALVWLCVAIAEIAGDA
jgi:hypothetical protein